MSPRSLHSEEENDLNPELRFSVYESPPTLCFPDSEKSCFACCPPIRPAGYEHVQHKNIVKRMLRENTIAFSSSSENISPITGFSCWALGYLDSNWRLVGCLLHPSQNIGRDLRHRIDYGDKCSRERCQASKIFLELKSSDRKFWLRLTDGLDSFSYSSSNHNPLFKTLGWGPKILGMIAERERGKILKKTYLFKHYPFFSSELDPRAFAYVVNKVIEENGFLELETESFRDRLEKLAARIKDLAISGYSSGPKSPYAHTLKLDTLFKDFLRLSAGIMRIDQREAEVLKKKVDEEIQKFVTF